MCLMLFPQAVGMVISDAILYIMDTICTAVYCIQCSYTVLVYELHSDISFQVINNDRREIKFMDPLRPGKISPKGMECIKKIK